MFLENMLCLTQNPLFDQEAKESIDEEDPRPTSSNGAYIMLKLPM